MFHYDEHIINCILYYVWKLSHWQIHYGLNALQVIEQHHSRFINGECINSILWVNINISIRFDIIIYNESISAIIFSINLYIEWLSYLARLPHKILNYPLDRTAPKIPDQVFRRESQTLNVYLAGK